MSRSGKWDELLKETRKNEKAIDGYVIVPPHNPMLTNMWELGKNTFDDTKMGAWRRHIGPHVNEMDVSTVIQRWHDKGYRLRNAKLIIYDKDIDNT